MVWDSPGIVICPYAKAAQAIISNNVPVQVRIRDLNQEDIVLVAEGLQRLRRDISPEELRRWEINVPRDPEEHDSDDGVICRSKDEGKDWKAFLHYRPDLLDLLAARDIVLTSWQEYWLAACDRVWNACFTTACAIADAMDRERPGFHFRARIDAVFNQHVLRALLYDPRTGMIAKTHADRASLTLHVAESTNGLYCYMNWHKHMLDMPFSREALCFPGNQLEKITHGSVRALYHGVENNAPDKVRWAIVFFTKMYSVNGIEK